MEPFLRRLDTNGNGMIDAEEVAGDQKSLVEGMFRRAGIELKYPIPVSRILAAMTDSSRRSHSDGAARPPQGRARGPRPIIPRQGHPSAARLSQNRRSRRCPALDRGRGRTKSGPTASSSEPAASAPPSTSSPSSPSPSAGKPGEPQRRRQRQRPIRAGPPARFGLVSYRQGTPPRRPARLVPAKGPQRRRTDHDGRVLAERTPEIAAEFERFDLNHDGIITAAECLKV